MKNINGNLFNHIGSADVICITTNGFIKANGQCVMGRGCALEAKTRWPQAAINLADMIKKNGNIPQKIWSVGDEGKETEVWSFPVKHNWWEDADIDLIRASCTLISLEADERGWTNVVIPRPGCGNGRLSYTVVEPALKELLDDRFSIITY